MTIPGGYYIKARCIKKSAIAHAPPFVRELWDYLLREACHKETKYNGFTLKRGQLFKSYREIREDLHWHVGYRKMMYNENHTKKGMKYLMKKLMITSVKEPRGVVITICNYDYFQNPKNYEGTDEGTNEGTNEEPRRNQHVPSINKNDKELKNGKNNKTLEPFDQFWEIYPKKKAKGEAKRAWKKINPKKELVVRILDAVKNARQSQNWKKDNGQYIPYPATWLNREEWEDEVEENKEELVKW